MRATFDVRRHLHVLNDGWSVATARRIVDETRDRTPAARVSAAGHLSPENCYRGHLPIVEVRVSSY